MRRWPLVACCSVVRLTVPVAQAEETLLRSLDQYVAQPPELFNTLAADPSPAARADVVLKLLPQHSDGVDPTENHRDERVSALRQAMERETNPEIRQAREESLDILAQLKPQLHSGQ